MNLLQRLLRLLGFWPDPPRVTPSAAAVQPVANRAPEPDLAATAEPGPTAPEPAADPYFAPADAAAGLSAAFKAKAGHGLGLDPGAYRPLSSEEIRQAAKGQNLLANAWFGRRDLIPPADDLRTALIDGGMLAQGFIAPEQLREVHEVGALMDRVRPTLQSIEHAALIEGEAAVEADREARARVKERKKAEAAARRAARAEAIARRKATDILFLGRGVSARLGRRASDVEALHAAGLPALSTPAELAEALGLSVPRLRWLAFHAEVATRTHYVQFHVPKRSGGTRTLSAPHRTLAEAQRWILRTVVDRLPVEPAAQGFVRGRSILTNATPHAGKAVVVNMDLNQFFPSIGWARVRMVFERAGYSPAVATILALLCTECPRRAVAHGGVTYQVATGPRGLPQGASTSPGLSNQVARRLDRRLSGLAAKLGATYTRYADDLTFSGDGELSRRVGYLMARVRHIAGDEGFVVNEAKSRVLRPSTAQMVTGLVVNDRPGVARAEVRRLRAILHRARTEGLDAQNREGRPDIVAWLRGKIAFVAMARPEVGAKLKAELEALLERR